MMPATSQPMQARPPGPNKNKFPIEALARREGVKLQEVYVPKNIVIPTKNQAPIALKAGQRVMVIKTPKGIYLRLRDQIVKIRLHADSLRGLFAPAPMPTPTAAEASDHKKPSVVQSAAKPDVVTLHSSGEDD